MKSMEGTKYVYPVKGGYNVLKRVDGKQVNFGFSKTLIGALMIRDYCISHDWSRKYPKQPCKHISNYQAVDKHIYAYTGKTGTTYRVNKTINQKNVDYGSYDSLEKAQYIRDAVKANNWKPLPRNPVKHITKTPQGHYIIQKWLDGKPQTFGTFTCLTDAVSEVEKLIECNWDMDVLCDLTGTDDDMGEVWVKRPKGVVYFDNPNNGRNDSWVYNVR